MRNRPSLSSLITASLLLICEDVNMAKPHSMHKYSCSLFYIMPKYLSCIFQCTGQRIDMSSYGNAKLKAFECNITLWISDVCKSKNI